MAETAEKGYIVRGNNAAVEEVEILFWGNEIAVVMLTTGKEEAAYLPEGVFLSKSDAENYAAQKRKEYANL